MKIYWSLKSVPELAALTRKQRRRVHEQCLRRHFWLARATRRSVAAYLALFFTFLIIVAGGDSILSACGIAGSIWVTSGLALIGALAGWFVFSRIAIPILRPFYREFIERDERHVQQTGCSEPRDSASV